MSRGFLLDTNIPSEQIKIRPEPRVGKWLAQQTEDSLYLSALTIGELRRGIALLPDGKRKDQIERWFEIDVLPRFSSRILPVTQEIGMLWGRLSAARQRSGMPLAIADGLIAATAVHHELTLVTRNMRDFLDMGLEILNTWSDGV